MVMAPKSHISHDPLSTDPTPFHPPRREREREAFSVRAGSGWSEPGVPKPPTKPVPFHLSTADTAVAVAAAHKQRHEAADGPARRGSDGVHPSAQRALLQQALDSDGLSFLQGHGGAGVGAGAGAGGSPSQPQAQGAGAGAGASAGPRSGGKSSGFSQARSPPGGRAGDVTLAGPGIDITHVVAR